MQIKNEIINIEKISIFYISQNLTKYIRLKKYNIFNLLNILKTKKEEEKLIKNNLFDCLYN